MIGRAGAAIAILLLSGCAVVGRDYKRSEVPAPTAWHGPSTKGDAQLQRWWTSFADPKLDRVIDEALARNLDLALAIARIDEARARRGVIQWARAPDIDAQASARRSQTADLTNFPGILHNQFEAGFDASWEIDVWGGLHRALEASGAELAALHAAHADVFTVIAAETARAYLDLVAARELLAVANEDLASQRRLRDTVDARLKAGAARESDLAQSEAQVADQEALIPDIELRRTDALARLSVLMTLPPGDLLAGDPQLAVERLPMPSVMFSAGLPSDLVWRRSDLRRAEREVARATAAEGVMERNMYPRFSLTGSFGLQSEQSGDFGESGSQFWSIGPAVRWPLLQIGQVRNEVRAAESRTRQAEIVYHKAVIAAFAEVEQALAGVARAQERARASDRAAAEHMRALAIVQARYEIGAETMIVVLLESHATAAARSRAIESRRAMALSVVALAKALGGGWDPPPLENKK
jgi:NodT family efflux transporter outer membrane factor (OMF) lipoprotein